jgi:integrase
MILKRRTRAGKLRYGVRIERGSEQVWVGTFDTLAEARKQEAQARLNRTTTARMTADRWAEFWLEGYKGRVKASSYVTADAALRKFAKDFRGVPLGRIDRLSAEKWARANRYRVASVVTLLNAAVEADLLDRNPFAGLSHKGEGRKRIAPLTVADVDELAQAAEDVHGDYGPTMRALVIFLAYTGMRPGEAFALEWDDIDFEQHRIRVERRLYKGTVDLPKSNRTRRIVLPPPARDALLTLDGPRSGRVFNAKRGGPLSQSMLTGYWQRVTARTGRSTTPYELRHFAAHHLYVTMGLPARVVAVQLGHDGPKLVEQLYGHGDVGALEEIDGAFSKVVPLASVSARSTARSTEAATGTT